MSDDDETSDREGPIGIRVLLSSGELDEWTDTGGVRVEDEGYLEVLDLGNRLLAIYAPGMWMRIEFDLPEPSEEPEGPDDVPSVEAVRNLLLLVGVSRAGIKRWTPEERKQVADWAAAVHLAASDNPVLVPPMPGILNEG